MAFSQVISKSTGHALYNTETKRMSVLLTKLIDAADIVLPADHDAMVEKDKAGEKSEELKYFYSIPVKAITRNWKTGEVTGMAYGKVDRDALAEAFPGIVAPMPRPSNYRER